MPKRQVILIAHDVRSAQNVGSLIRTAEGMGAAKFIASGYTPYPMLKNDPRLPHLAERLTRQISKTSLGAERALPIEATSQLAAFLNQLKKDGYMVIGLEQTPDSINLKEFQPPSKIALIVGNEVSGLPKAVLALCQQIVEIPMKGTKESFNVSVAAAVALYHFELV